MEQCRMLVECSSASFEKTLKEELEQFFYSPANPPIIRFAKGKEQAKSILFRGDGPFDLVISELVPEELENGLAFGQNFRSYNRFDQLTSHVETLQLAYRVKEAMPFGTFIVAADFSAFEEMKIFELAMKAKKIGVETFLRLPVDKFQLCRLLEFFEVKYNYEQWAFGPIGNYFPKIPALIEKC